MITWKLGRQNMIQGIGSLTPVDSMRRWSKRPSRASFPISMRRSSLKVQQIHPFDISTIFSSAWDRVASCCRDITSAPISKPCTGHADLMVVDSGHSWTVSTNSGGPADESGRKNTGKKGSWSVLPAGMRMARRVVRTALGGVQAGMRTAICKERTFIKMGPVLFCQLKRPSGMRAARRVMRPITKMAVRLGRPSGIRMAR